MDHIYLDKSGTLRQDIIYQLRIARLDLPVRNLNETGVLARRVPTEQELIEQTDEEYVTAMLVKPPKIRTKSRCKLEPSHYHEQFATQLEAEVLRGPSYAPFIYDQFIGQFFISQDFAARLKDSRLTGIHLEPVRIVAHETPIRFKAMFALQPCGQSCDRGMSVRGAPNACPHCGKGYIFCEECGFQIATCPYCDGIMWNLRRNLKPGEKTLVLCPLEDRSPQIINGKDWDGSDFIHGRYRNECFITKRALDWMLSVHAAPFFAVPVLIDVDGMSDKQLQWLKDAQDMVSLKK